MTASKEWFAEADDAAMGALPAHLRLFIATPETSYQAAPVPVLVGEEQWVLSAFCDDTGPGFNVTLGVPRTIYAPRVLQWIHYPSGKFRWEEPAPNAYGLLTATTDDAGVRLGPIERGHLQKMEWYNATISYLPLVCRVVERRWLVTAYPITEEERATARELQQCVRALYDAPLLPYYRHYGHHFLGWIERAAK
ncbi:hypothetical protein [Hymenobacter terrenus]|uniref:hypothetical protein n=1 Tax=Hymenobacter terrenus TaxID=1629124 RepID=UPI000619FF58|nr:hypothetical protein [Hymenobacter terrenus]